MLELEFFKLQLFQCLFSFEAYVFFDKQVLAWEVGVRELRKVSMSVFKIAKSPKSVVKILNEIFWLLRLVP